MSSELNKLPEPFGYVSDWFGAPDGLMRFSRTPFPELHNLTHSVCSVFSVPQVLDVQQQAYAAGKAERTAELEGGACLAGLLGLVADIRAACGDKGQRMQPELIDHIRQGFAERDKLRAEAERQTRAMKVIYTWAGVPGALNPEHVRDLCGKALAKDTP